MLETEIQAKSKVLDDYSEELELFEKALKFVILVSQNQHGIQTDGRGIRSVRIFNRQTLTAISLCKLLPRSIYSKRLESDLWDISSIASLTRNIIEGYLSLYYFGIEKISEQEAELRFFLLQLHKNSEWYNIRKNEMDEAELKQFEDGIAWEKSRLRTHIFLSHLSPQEQKRVLDGREMYKTKSDFEENLSVCKDLKIHYRHLSNLVHTLPLSTERIDNERGRGLGTEPDINYCLICVMLARKYIAATVVDVVEKFKNELADRFKKELEEIKPLVKKGFN
jgi:hypothetical protein